MEEVEAWLCHTPKTLLKTTKPDNKLEPALGKAAPLCAPGWPRTFPGGTTTHHRHSTAQPLALLRVCCSELVSFHPRTTLQYKGARHSLQLLSVRPP